MISCFYEQPKTIGQKHETRLSSARRLFHLLRMHRGIVYCSYEESNITPTIYCSYEESNITPTIIALDIISVSVEWLSGERYFSEPPE